MITGIMDVHPRLAMQMLNSDKREDYLDFYEKVTSEANV